MREVREDEDLRVITASDLPRDAWFTALCILVGLSWALGVIMGAVGMGWFLASRAA